jgi:hypothetical protein
LEALNSDEQVTVQNDDWLIFSPTGSNPTTGVIFYPGGRVLPSAYAPAGRALAAQGYLAIIPKMPLNLAVFAPNIASSIIADFPQIQSWVIGGHSLGGAMAASFTRKHPSSVQGIFFWAAYPASGDDLSSIDLDSISVYGTLDGIAEPDTVRASEGLLPITTTWVPIEGGNHAQFGWYGDQPGDNPAQITREAQQVLAIQAVVKLLETVTD